MDSKRTLEEIYQSLPTVECKGLCWESCGTISISPAEMAHITNFVNNARMELKPFASLIEATVKSIDHLTNHSEDCRCIFCPYLEDKRCTIHPVRPFVCRIYGIAEGLKCPHNCKVIGKRLTRKEAYALMDEIRNLSA